MNAPARETIACPSCGTENDPTRTLCWLCYEPLARKTLKRRSAAEPIFEETIKDSAAAMVALVIALAIVCCGVVLIAPGLGIGLAILMVFPFVRATILVKRRAEQGVATSTASSVIMFLGSIVLSIIVLAVVGIVAFGTFCLSCIGAEAASNDDRFAVVIACSATLAVVGIMGFFIFRWIRWSWYQDLRK